MTSPTKEERDRIALVILEFELPSLRASVRLAEAIVDAVNEGPIRHPVLQFALDKAPTSVVENILLRLPEVLEIMERVRHGSALTSIYQGKGRDRSPTHPALRLAYDLRQERVAHRVKVGLDRQAAWPRVASEFGTVWKLLNSSLEALEVLVSEVRRSGALESVMPGPRTARREYAMFTSNSVVELIASADRLLPLPPP
jgi:hypothetical protein